MFNNDINSASTYRLTDMGLDVVTDKKFIICVYSEKASVICKLTCEADDVYCENINCSTVQEAKTLFSEMNPKPVVANIEKRNGQFIVSRKEKNYLIKEIERNAKCELIFKQVNLDEIKNEYEEKLEYLKVKAELLLKLKDAKTLGEQIEIKTQLSVLEAKYENKY